MAVTSNNARGRSVAVFRCLTLLALLPLHLAVLAMSAVAVFLLLCCQVYLFPAVVLNIRWLPTLRRGLVVNWTGIALPPPYLPEPPPPEPDERGFYQARHGRKVYLNGRLPRWQDRCRWVWTDPATVRDLLWLVLDPIIGTALACLPVALIGGGLFGAVARPALGLFAIPIGLALAVLGWLLASPSVALHARWTALLLARRVGPAPPARQRWVGDTVSDLFNSLRVVGMSLGAGVLFVVEVLALALTGPLLGMPVVRHGRTLPASFRCLLGEWWGVPTEAPYRPAPAQRANPADGGYPPVWVGWRARWTWLVTDPATWRDLLWLGTQPMAAAALVLAPVLVFAYGWWGLALPALESMTWLGTRTTPWYGSIAGSNALGFVVGLACIVLSSVALPRFLGWHARWAALLLAPTGQTRLRLERDRLHERVATLTQSRSVVMDTQANEVRRIERDLHDGAQARLVAMGMTLGAVEALIDHDPAAAKKLLAQARDSSRTALRELRDLVRGIHPPVLAERGLPDAIRALALDNPLDVEVQADVPGRAEAPVESAAYFAVAEALANATKHAHADRVWIDLRYEEGRLRISVLDDGCGGADATRGSGLRGIERRLSSFDGMFSLSSPLGGPTMVAMEVPCVLSSPRTSTSSGTD
jgi:signal transduction histidine kinase